MALPATPDFSVGIVGAGLGGLQVARVLQQHGVHTRVFERETSPVSRDQGGMLDLDPKSGQRALQIAGLMNEFHRIAHPEADALRIVDKTGRVIFDDEELTVGVEKTPIEGDQQGPQLGFRGRPEVDRGELRQILIDSILPDTIKWGHNLFSCKMLGSGKVELVFSTAEATPKNLSLTFDMVVGADGAWSRVRPLLSTAKPEYTGVQFVEAQISNVDSAFPEIARFIGRGSLMALGGDKAVMAQRNIGGNVRVYLAFRVPFSSAAWLGIESLVEEKQSAKAQERLLSEFAEWGDEARAVISSTDVEKSTFSVRPLMMLPSDHTWETVGRVTLIGDAAHVMSPYAGEGANLAMLDGAELGEAIASWKEGLHGDEKMSLVDAIGHFEKRMLARSKERSEKSIGNQRLCMGDGNPAETFGARMRKFMSGGPPALPPGVSV